MNDNKIEIDLGSVQRTLLIPLLSRAKETDKEHPLLIDHLAKSIIANADFDFSGIEKAVDDQHQIVWIIRAINFDHCVREFLLQHEGVLVFNIGAGLDTTFHRIDDGQVRWINLDLPDVIRMRKSLIPESEREFNLGKNVFDFTWMNEVAHHTKDRSLCFMAAGVFCYFTSAELKVLFKRLSETYPSAHLLFDAMSWLTVWGANRSIMKKSGMDPGVLLKWYLRRTKDLYKWADNLQIIEEYPMFSKLPATADLPGKMLRDMRIADLLGMYKMVHIRF